MAQNKTVIAGKKLGPQLICAAALAPVFATINYLVYLLRFEGQLSAATLAKIGSTIGCVVLIKLLVFGWFRIYQEWNRYVTFYDLLTLCQATTVGSLLLVLGDYLFFPDSAIPRSVFLMDWGATIVVVGGLRAARRLAREHGRLLLRPRGETPVFIVGANDSGEALLRVIHRNRDLPYHVVGFIAENIASLRSRIGGVAVIGTLEQTCDLAKQYGVAEILITAGELPGRQVRKLVDDGRRHDVRVKVLPSYEQLLGGRVAVQPRAVSIEDLLRREPVHLDMTSIRQWIDQRVLLVTGSAGSIGSEISRQLLQWTPSKVILVDRSENGQFFLERQLRSLSTSVPIEVCVADISDAGRMRDILHRHRPEIVFHAAAYKHVPLMETNPGEAVKNIVLATRQLADLAIESDVKSLVMISTDKAVNPSSVMGACKRVAELYIQSLRLTCSCRFATVRFGNVLDSAGSVVPIFREQIAAGGPVTVTDARFQRYFMTIPEASQLVIQAGAMGQGGEIFVLDMGDPVRIVDLATDMVRLSGLQLGEDIELEFIGCRPGEKLVEELHNKGETLRTTGHPKITIVEGDRIDRQAIRNNIKRLQAAVSFTDEMIVSELQRIVPEYGASSSRAYPGRSAAA